MTIHELAKTRIPRIALVLTLAATCGLALGAREAQESEPKAPHFQPVVVVELAVSDLDRSIEFYTETLGMELESRIDAFRWAKVRTSVPGLSLGLGQEDEVEGSGTVSVNLAVADADGVRAQLEARGVEFQGATIEIPGVVRLADFTDPDGNRFRLAGPPSAGK